MQIDFNQLKVLVALDDERNITKAAQRLHISQSGASHNLAKLRERFGDELFVRTSSGMEPTPFVQKMLPILRQGMSTIERSLQTQKSFEPTSDSKTFYIGACDYFEFIALPKLAAKFTEHAPNIRVSVDINSEHVKMERVESGRLDLYVGVDDVQYIPSNFNRYNWLTDPYVGVVSKHRNIDAKLTLAQFAAEEHIHLPVVGGGFDAIDDWLKEQQLSRTIKFVGQSYTACARMSASSGLLFCVPFRVAKQLVEMLPLKMIELPDGVPKISLSILTHKLYDHDDGLNWLISEILNID